MIMFPNDYLTIAKVVISLSSLFPKFILRSFENRTPVVALVDWFMCLMSRVHFQKHSLYRMYILNKTANIYV